MLSTNGLVKRLGGRPVVDGVSLAVGPGEVVGLLGPNGAGKTTCFQLVVGLLPADGGTVLLDGEDVTREPMHLRARRGLGYLPQEASVFRNLDVRDNVMAALELRGDLDRAARRAALERLLEELEVRHLRRRKGRQLSGGERRRVEIARALATDPSYLLLDEPFAGIDPISVADVQALVRALAGRGIGVLVTDHNVREALQLCDRAYILSGGTVLAEGTPDRILEDRDVRQVYLGTGFRL